MSPLAFIFIIIAASNLHADYKHDSGKHKKAKIFHAILITLVLIEYSGAISQLWAIFTRTSLILDTYNTSIGMFSNYFNLVFFFLGVLLSIIVLIMAFKMLKRDNESRRFFLLYFPFLCIISIFDFYRGWMEEGNDSSFNDLAILTTGMVFFGGIAYLYIHVYDSSWMKAFFNLKSDTPEDKIDLYE